MKQFIYATLFCFVLMQPAWAGNRRSTDTLRTNDDLYDRTDVLLSNLNVQIKELQRQLSDYSSRIAWLERRVDLLESEKTPLALASNDVPHSLIVPISTLYRGVFLGDQVEAAKKKVELRDINEPDHYSLATVERDPNGPKGQVKYRLAQGIIVSMSWTREYPTANGADFEYEFLRQCIPLTPVYANDANGLAISAWKMIFQGRLAEIKMLKIRPDPVMPNATRSLLNVIAEVAQPETMPKGGTRPR